MFGSDTYVRREPMTLAFYELLREIEHKPGLYIRRPSVTDLQMFLAGYHFARYEFRKNWRTVTLTGFMEN